MNEEKSEFANAMYKLGKVAILRFAELLEKEGITENTGKTIEDASAVIRNFEKAGFDCTEEKIALSKAQSIFNKSKNVMKELPIGTEIKLPFTTLKVEAIEKSRFIYGTRLGVESYISAKPNNTTNISNLGNRTNNIVSEKELRENRKTE